MSTMQVNLTAAENLLLRVRLHSRIGELRAGIAELRSARYELEQMAGVDDDVAKIESEIAENKRLSHKLRRAAFEASPFVQATEATHV